MTSQELDNLFKTDKSSWFIEVESGIRIWKMDLVQKFWDAIRTYKIDKNDYNFEKFVFPTFSKSFHTRLNLNYNYFVEVFGPFGKIIPENVLFKNCRFQGDTLFLNNIPGITSSAKGEITFLKNLTVENCQFEQEFQLQGQKLKGFRLTKCDFYREFKILLCNFSGKSSINNCNFNNKFLYHGNKNLDGTSFGSNKFEKEFSFSRNNFSSNFTINTGEFNGKITIHSNNYKKHCSLVSVQINDKSSFKNENYYSCSFQEIDFSLKNHLFEEISFKEKLAISNTIFPNTVVIRRSDCSKMVFLNSDISEVKFSSCFWNSGERLIVLNESQEKESDNLLKLKNFEFIYRQLKRNFDDSKDWELSGKAYISEMLMRKKRLWEERNFASWFIYSFYDIFGGFTQNYIKPLIWLFIFTGIIFPIYYLVFEFPGWINIYEIENNYNYEDIFIKSFAASVPWLKTELMYYNWWVQALQTTMSAVLITFFILALRKRFKQ